MTKLNSNKLHILLLVFFVLTILTSCSRFSESNVDSTADALENEEDLSSNNDKLLVFTPSDYKLERTHAFVDVPYEEDYSHIHVDLDKEEYSVNDVIVCTLQSDNPGVGFYYFSEPLLFEMDGDKPLTNPTDRGLWLYCAVEDSRELFSTDICVNLSEVDTLKGGVYKIFVFVGDVVVEKYFLVKED
ncbi:MAG: hypothetical protein PUJ57_05380 [Peptoniphilaceae bacterium]|nr:hypothetical protein [Peptoniphilaceae bacterium]MDY6085575.1 hypothetical protein [Peptoniphilaceae bacterium]